MQFQRPVQEWNKMPALEVSIANGVQLITLNRPEKKNAINKEMYEGLISVLTESAQNDSVVVTVLTGAGDYYSSGNDFSPQDLSDIDQITGQFAKFVDMFIDYPKLLVAIVNGPAIGIAVTTLAFFDIVFASNKAWFRTPFTRLGLVPEGCSTYTFPRIMGIKACRLLYLNETMSASEALSCGFITRVFPHAELVRESFALINEYAKLPLESLKMSKELVRKWDKELLHQVNREESKKLGERFGSEEFFNAMLQFSKKKSSKL